jgi:N-acetylmuramoyl-L-alanine amidase
MMDDQFTNRANRKSRGVKQAGFVVLYEASMPSLLVEVGFLSNPSEQRFLASEYGQSIMASAIFRSVRDYKVEYERSRELTSSN